MHVFYSVSEFCACRCCRCQNKSSFETTECGEEGGPPPRGGWQRQGELVLPNPGVGAEADARHNNENIRNARHTVSTVAAKKLIIKILKNKKH